jgi:pimeloyl-ACP methyl ester carboxylesterase
VTAGDVEELEGVGRYRRFGDGPPVVILSNPLANPDFWAARHVDALVAAGYQAITFVHTGAEHHHRGVTRDVVEFLASLGCPPVRLLGWSQGAAIAQEVALAASELVACAALIATYGRQNHFDRILQDAWAELDRADAELANLRLAMLFLTGEPPQLLGDDDYLNDRMEGMRPWAMQPRDGELRRRSRAFIDSYQDRLDALRDVEVPCLVIGFELDTDTFAVRAREVAASIRDCRYLEIAGAGHLLPVTDPKRVLDPVLAFFREVDLAGY